MFFSLNGGEVMMLGNGSWGIRLDRASRECLFRLYGAFRAPEYGCCLEIALIQSMLLAGWRIVPRIAA